MSKVLDFGHADTTVVGTPPTLTIPMLSWESDFRIKSEDSKEVILTNITMPLNMEEKVRFAYSEIADIFANSGLASTNSTRSKKGINLLAQLSETIKVTDTTDSTYLEYLPVTAHLVLKLPQSDVVTQSVVDDLVKRLIASLYDGSTSKVMTLLKGVLAPKGL